MLATLVPDGVEPGGVAVVPQGTSPLASMPLPAVAASVSYVDGVTGGNVFVFPGRGASGSRPSMMGTEPGETSRASSTELELSAVGEAMNQMMAAAAAATGARARRRGRDLDADDDASSRPSRTRPTCARPTCS